MNSRTSIWMVGVTAVVIATGLMYQFRQTTELNTAPVQSAQPKAVVTTQPAATELPPGFDLLSDPGPPSSKPPKKGKPPPQDPAARAALNAPVCTPHPEARC